LSGTLNQPVGAIITERFANSLTLAVATLIVAAVGEL
jgi:ABC-type dipeptide/oligopeptide/nickel transport system permease component